MLEDDFPGVDVDVGVHPAVALVEEEHEVVFVLAVKIFLVGHLPVVLAFDHEGVVDKRDVDYALALFVVDADADVLALDETADGVFGYAGRNRGDGGASGGGVDAGCAGALVMGEIAQLFVGDKSVVPVHRAVGGRDGEGEVVLVDGLA